MGVDYAGFCKLNIGALNPAAKGICYRTLQEMVGHSNMVMGSSGTRSESFYKPGRTMSIAQNNMTARVFEKGADELGQWTYMKCSEKGRKVVTFISVYQPCKQAMQQAGQFNSIACYEG
jgi:hypothetical protein